MNNIAWWIVKDFRNPNDGKDGFYPGSFIIPLY